MIENSFEIAWAAGLFEGEGSIYRYRPTTTLPFDRIRLQIYLTDCDVLARFAEILEGRVTGPYGPKGEMTKPKWSWTEGRQQHVKSILDAFWPYLGERRRSRAIELGFLP